MSYAPNTYASKGFEYGATKKEDGSGYFVEVRYTYQNAALAVPDAAVRQTSRLCSPIPKAIPHSSFGRGIPQNGQPG